MGVNFFMGVNFISRYDRGMREMAANLLGNGSRQRPDIGALDARLLTGEAHVVERAEARAQNGEALDDRDVVPTRERDVPVHALDQFEVARIGVFGRKLARQIGRAHV